MVHVIKKKAHIIKETEPDSIAEELELTVDLTADDMEKTLQTPIRIVQSDGKSFIDSIIM